MDFHKAIAIDNSESDKLLNTFIFMSTVVIPYILRVFLSLTGCRVSYLKRGKIRVQLQNSLTYRLVAEQCNNILLPLFWLTNKNICISRKT